MCGSSPHKAEFLWREAGAPPAVEAHEAPTVTPVDKRNTELIAKRKALQDFPIARAALTPAAGLDVQAADDSP